MHEAIGGWYRADAPPLAAPTIPQAALEAIGAAPETASEALRLAGAYIEHYGRAEVLPMRGVEEPYARVLQEYPRIELVAKPDAWFDTAVPIETAELGVLPAGRYSVETKTRGASGDRAAWMAQWQTSLQPSFQMFALGGMDLEAASQIRLIINVIDVPRPYEPKRTCKSCHQVAELGSWIPAGDQYACPYCGAAQALKPYEPEREKPPVFWRMLVSRPPSELALHRELIWDTARQMWEAAVADRSDRAVALALLNPCACFPAWGRGCEFVQEHFGGVGAGPELEAAPDYAGVRVGWIDIEGCAL